eukprot:Sdes_comp24065_c0_seq1m22129
MSIRISVQQVKTKTAESFPKLVPWIGFHKGDITSLAVSAIVNAANNSLLGGGGVDGAIHRAAGPELLKECRLLNGCETGKAKITNGYRLPAQYVIHSVGPVYHEYHFESEAESVLRSCYQNCFRLASDRGLSSIAFPCISTGVYGFPNEKACEIAIESALDWFQKEHGSLQYVIFCVFLDKDEAIYRDKLSKICK